MGELKSLPVATTPSNSLEVVEVTALRLISIATSFHFSRSRIGTKLVRTRLLVDSKHPKGALHRLGFIPKTAN